VEEIWPRKRILIVDDDSDYAAAIEKILKTADYSVSLAGDVKSGNGAN